MIEKSKFGRTNHFSTRLLFGAAAFYNTKDSDVVKKTMELVEQSGINHIDTAESYGESQKMLGPWLKHNRNKFFLATKTKYRTYKEAKEDIKKSLDLLNVDYVDLWQMHCLAEPEEWNNAKDPETGALRAFIEAKEEGLVKFLGVTSHGMKAANVMNTCINEFNFESVLTPYNYSMMQDNQYKSDFEMLYNNCKEKNVALQLIKTICKGPWPIDAEQTYNTWYEPLTNQADIDSAIGWALQKKGAFINSAADVTLLPKIIQAAEKNKKVSEKEISDLAMNLGLSNLFEE